METIESNEKSSMFQLKIGRFWEIHAKSRNVPTKSHKNPVTIPCEKLQSIKPQIFVRHDSIFVIFTIISA